MRDDERSSRRIVLAGLTIIFALVGFCLHGGACIMGVIAGIAGMFFILSLGDE